MGDEKKCPCDALLRAKNDIKDHDNRLHAGDTQFKVMEHQLKTIGNDIQEIKTDLRELKEKPARKWEGTVGKVTDWAILLMLAYMATQIGLQ